MFSEQVFDEFFKYSNVGLAVLDQNLCFCYINESLACINGRPQEQHPGRHIREILGPQMSDQLELVITQVLKTGRPMENIKLGGPLAGRPSGGRWIGNYFPLPGPSGLPERIGVVVVELEGENEVVGTDVSAQHASHILRTWKDIARYTGTCAKTVQRWERDNDLPVHRVREGKGAVVFALSNELDSWLQSQTVRRH